MCIRDSPWSACDRRTDSKEASERIASAGGRSFRLLRRRHDVAHRMMVFAMMHRECGASCNGRRGGDVVDRSHHRSVSQAHHAEYRGKRHADQPLSGWDRSHVPRDSGARAFRQSTSELQGSLTGAGGMAICPAHDDGFNQHRFAPPPYHRGTAWRSLIVVVPPDGLRGILSSTQIRGMSGPVVH